MWKEVARNKHEHLGNKPDCWIEMTSVGHTLDISFPVEKGEEGILREDAASLGEFYDANICRIYK